MKVEKQNVGDIEYGYFAERENEYIITNRRTPRHWYNYYFNDTYISFASQTAFGEGFCQDDFGRRIRLITDRCVYLTDQENGEFHTADGRPVRSMYDRFSCRHGLGYSTICCEKNGIASEHTIFVPTEGNFEQWIVKVVNRRKKKLKLAITAYTANELDGAYTPQGYNSLTAEYDRRIQAVCAQTLTQFDSPEPHVAYGYMISDGEVSGFDARHNAFIGVYGNRDYPDALLDTGGCTNSVCCAEKCCQTLEVSCELEPEEERTVCFQIGYAANKEEIKKSRKYLEPGMPEYLLEEVKSQRLREIEGVKIKTPDHRLNQVLNGFYKYATNMGSRWARVRHNGYRDICSDTECLGSFNPELAWKRFKRILVYQYSNGYAPRTFLDGSIRSNCFSDNAVWIVFTGYALIMELGDLSLLTELVGFNDGSSGSVFEHMRRAVQYLYDFQGLQGLIRIWGGDWQVGMNRAGLEGKGVSIWWSIAWYRANTMLVELADLRGEREIVEKHRNMGETMRQRIEKYGYDGSYYIAAINDKGKKIGSRECEEGKMFLIPQLWAVLAGIAPYEKLMSIMEEVDQYLETPLGTLVNKPGYKKYDPDIGNLTSQPTGTLINCAVYLHPMAWKLAVEGMLKRPEKLQMTLEKILPWNHRYAVTYGEPYILYNFYHGPETGYREGKPGQSWRTGSAQWVVKALINYCFGLKPRLNGLELDPCLVPDWQECEIQKQFRGCHYTICYHQKKGNGCGIRQILVDGKKLDGKILPYRNGGRYTVDVYIGEKDGWNG